MKKLLALKRVAYNNIKKEIKNLQDFEEAVCIWWRDKYNIPDTDLRFLNKEIEDIVIEYFEHQFKEDPQLLQAYESGFGSTEEMEEEEMKKIMGDDYTSTISYLEKPPTPPSQHSSEEEEVVLKF